jgi:hypothetical protein
LPWIALGWIAGALADAPDEDIAVVDQPTFLSGVAVSTAGEMGHCPMKALGGATGKLSIDRGSDVR